MHADLLGGIIVILLKDVLRFGEEECLLAQMNTGAGNPTNKDSVAGVNVATEFLGKVSTIAKARR